MGESMADACKAPVPCLAFSEKSDVDKISAFGIRQSPVPQCHRKTSPPPPPHSIPELHVTVGKLCIVGVEGEHV